jgi:hypothetical protein
MRKSEVEAMLLKCAEVSGRTIADPDIDAVGRSPDVDLYPKAGYDERNVDYQELMYHFGFDSDY